MSSAGFRRRLGAPGVEVIEPEVQRQQHANASRQRQAELMQLLWRRRRTLLRAALVAMLVSTLLAFILPATYTSTAELMPPDSQSSTGAAMMAALAGKSGAGLAGMATDLLGLKSSGALFMGVLRSETAQDRVIEQFNLKKVYGKRRLIDARQKLDDNTAVSEDKKSGIISISVSDHNPQRAAAMANAYIDQLNSLIAQLSTSAAHREHMFLEERLKVAKTDLDRAANDLAQFSSKNNTLDIQTEGKAMLDAASTLAGQLVVAQSELEGLRQIYSDGNARVKAMNARVTELRKQLDRLGGTQNGAGKNEDPAAPNLPGGLALKSPSTLSSSVGKSIPFPTIHNLPLLGAKYSDYYRNAKIQETVFELLTEQNELAKVEEAKETPSVKVLDPGAVPEVRSSASIVKIIFFGTIFGLACCVAWIIGEKKWEQGDPTDPRRLFALEVATTLKDRAPWNSENGRAPHSATHKVWGWFGRNRTPGNGASQP
jgi:capsule polysaccharide export protein KpsE/RkpR